MKTKIQHQNLYPLENMDNAFWNYLSHTTTESVEDKWISRMNIAINTEHQLSHEEKAINTAVVKVAEIANKMPGLVILYDVRDWTVAWMSEWGLKQLNISLEQLASLSAAQFYSTYINAEDSADYEA